MPKKKDQNEFDQVYAMLKKTELYAMADQLKRLETENQLYEMSTLEVISSIVNEELITKTNKKASYMKDRAHMYMTQADLNDGWQKHHDFRGYRLRENISRLCLR